MLDVRALAVIAAVPLSDRKSISIMGAARICAAVIPVLPQACEIWLNALSGIK
jgi:hypothetical protein